MSPAAKIVITLAVSFVVLAAATVGIGVILLSRHGGELLDETRKHHEQGMAVGRATDEAGCLNEAIARYKANPGLTSSLAIAMFEQGCFRVSRPTAGFCDGVPSPMDILRAGRWQQEQSRNAGIHDPFGGQVFAQVQAHCATKAAGPGR